MSKLNINGTKTVTEKNENSPNPYTVKGAGITLASSHSDTLFDVNNITNGEKLVTIDAAAVTYKLKIKGNELANKIIVGYDKSDKISITSGAIDDVTVNFDNLR